MAQLKELHRHEANRCHHQELKRKQERIPASCIGERRKKSSSNFRYKFWEHENHPVLLDNTEMYNQRLNYLHWNPVTASYITEPWHWFYSSAIDYFRDKKGLLDLVILDGF